MDTRFKPTMKVIRNCLSLGIVMHFLACPTAAQDVRALPANVVVALNNGGGAATCISSETTTDVDWLINGTSLRLLNLSSAMQENLVVLRFRDVPAEYNNSRIDCVANGVRSLEAITLLVQGLLAAVGSLALTTTEDFVFLNWTAPFTLDIAVTTVDITYCVEVVSLTSSSVLHSECEITSTEFRYPLLQRLQCSQFNFTVTPVNLAGNGTSSSVQLVKDDNHALIDLITSRSTFYIFLSETVCYADLRFMDANTGDIVSLSYNLTTRASNITLQTQLLTTNRLYRLTILESDVEVASEIIVSTHDVTNCSALAENGGIAISVNFVENSLATGVLIAFVSMSNSGTIDLTSSFLQVFNKSSITNGLVLPLNIFQSGSYMAYAYDIERDQKTMDGILYQASNCSFNVTSKQGNFSLSQNSMCSINSHYRVITVLCSFTSFQVLAQLNAQDSVGILHVNTSEDTQTPVTLHVPENGEYLVTILPIESSIGILSGVAFSQIQMVSPITDPPLLPLQLHTAAAVTASPSLPSSGQDCRMTGITIRAALCVILAADLMMNL